MTVPECYALNPGPYPLSPFPRERPKDLCPPLRPFFSDALWLRYAAEVASEQACARTGPLSRDAYILVLVDKALQL